MHRAMLSVFLLFGMSVAVADYGDGGVFGTWTTDPYGFPAFDYTLDQLAPTSPEYPTVCGGNGKLHWHQLGNDRINALATNDGHIVLFGQDRGPFLANRFDEQGRNFSGGYSFLRENGKTWSTAYRSRPKGATTTRIFGLGYVRSVIEHADLRVSRTTYAPAGDLPALLSEVVLENLGPGERSIEHFEYWDINAHQLRTQWLRSGDLAAWRGDLKRDELNRLFLERVSVDTAKRVLLAEKLVRPGLRIPPRDEPASIDYYPPTQFLAVLEGPLDGASFQQREVFPQGLEEPRLPVTFPLPAPQAVSAYGQPHLFLARSVLSLPPGGRVRLRFAYGYAYRAGELDRVLALGRGAEPFTATLAWWRRSLTTFSAEGEESLSREAMWRSYLLRSAVGYRDYWGVRVVPQGSAYLYLHGADGAPRDQALFTLPLVYADPELARDQLRLLLRLTRGSDGAIPYSFAGHGMHEHATIHRYPSDLDLYLFLAMGEYLGLTGDLAFLDEANAYHPRGAPPPSPELDYSVRSHLVAALRHLRSAVGFGEHGLVKIGDGDWSDAVVFESAVTKANVGIEYGHSVQHGESVPNSQLALYVLPFLAEALGDREPALAEELRETARRLEQPVADQWLETGYFRRAWLRDALNHPVALGEGEPQLEAQVWPLIAGNLPDARREALLATIAQRLDGPSPIGAPLWHGNMVWPAVAHLLTWGYKVAGLEDAAFTHLRETTYATHARLFPRQWAGIWSGPDGVYAPPHPQAGLTWTSPVTPMTDFPVMNANGDAMWLLGLYRACGILPGPRGLTVAPPERPERFELTTPVLGLRKEPRAYAGFLRGSPGARRQLRLRLPQDIQSATLDLDGLSSTVTPDEQGYVVRDVVFEPVTPLHFRLSW